MRRLFHFHRRSDRQIGNDVDQEVGFHLEMRTKELIQQGLSAADAKAQAQREFGDVLAARQALVGIDRRTEADQRRRDLLADLKDDLLFALRQMRGSRAFTIAALLTLTLGIGANTAIFSVVHGVLMRPLPFPEPEQLVKVWSANVEANNLRAPVSAVDLDDWRAQRQVIEEIGGYWYADGSSGTDLTGVGEPRRLSAAFVSPGFFPTLRVPARHGRLPREEEMVRGGPDRVVVLSHGFWLRQFGGAESIIGSTVTLGDQPFQVLGVMPADFVFPSDRVDAYIPFSTIPDASIPRIRPVRILDVVARMAPGVTVGQAQQEMNLITRRLSEEYSQDASWGAATVIPLGDALTGQVRAGLLVLLGAVAVVLLMGCVNVASLLLARGASRQRELAIRASMGATRSRIVRQLMTESFVLSLMGGALGLLVAMWGTQFLLSLAAGQLPRTSDIRLDGTVLLFALLVSLVTGIVFGLVPALRVSDPNLQGALREGGHGLVGGAHRLRAGLVVAEVALAAILVIGAGLMMRSFVTLLKVDPGFRPENLLAMSFTLSTNRHPAAEYRDVYQEIIETVRALPGVISAGAVKDAPFNGNGERNSFLPQGMVLGDEEQRPTADFIHLSEGYFRTIGTPVLSGREFTVDDRFGEPWVLVVNKALAERYFPGEDAVGKTLTIGATPARIVGVVGDIRQRAMEIPADPVIYIHNLQNSRVKTTLVARTQGEPLSMVPLVRDAIWSIDRQQTITSIFTFDQIVHDALARPRLLTVLLGSFAAIALTLGALGIYGVLAYQVSQRKQEIGVRMALGGGTAQVLRMIVGRGVGLALAGVAIGLGGAFVLTRFLHSVLYGVAPTDAPTFVAVAVVLVAVAGVASYMPARRAARIDPAIALRSD
jgi:predicted permease